MDTLTMSAAPSHVKDLVSKVQELGPLLEKHIQEGEENRRLAKPVVKALRSAGFYKLYLPTSLGGLEADQLTVAKVVEEVAHYNTAAGWSLMVANTTQFMLSHLSEKGINAIFEKNPDAFIAGTVHPPMRAVKADGGFKLTGRNPLVSNVREADWIFTTAMVMDGDRPGMHDGHPVMIGAYIKASDCEILDTWFTSGMKATDSADAEAKDVLVPDHLTFPLSPEFEPNAQFQSKIFQAPSAAANVASLLAPVAIAVAANAIEELKSIINKKTPLGSMVTLREKGVVQRKLGQAEAMVRSSRAYLHHTLAKCLKQLDNGESITLEEKADILLSAVHANRQCVEAVELVYTAAGTSGIYTKNKLSRLFADAQVIRQHGFMNESRYETAAQMLLGMFPDLPLVAL